MDEPRDPFGPPGGGNVVADGELLWNQLFAIEKWNDFKRALQALSRDDLAKIVLFQRFALSRDAG